MSAPFKPNTIGATWNGQTARDIDDTLNDIYRWLRRLQGGTVGADGRPGIGIPGMDGADGEPGPPGVRGVDGVIGRDGAPGIPGIDGVDGYDGPPGVPGVAGAAGAAGPAGPVTLGPMGEDGRDGEDGPPGPPGASGAAGAAGPAGPVTLGPMGADGEDGDDGFVGVIVGGVRRRTLGMCFDGAGSVPTVGTVGYVVCPFTGTIDQWSIVADASGSAVVDVWKAAGAIPTNGDTIAGSEKPTLSAQQLNSDTALTTWSTTVTAGDVFGFELESASTVTRVTVQVRITEAP